MCIHRDDVYCKSFVFFKPSRLFNIPFQKDWVCIYAHPMISCSCLGGPSYAAGAPRDSTAATVATPAMNSRRELCPQKRGGSFGTSKKGKLSSSTCQQQTSSQPEIWWAITALHGFSNLLPTIWQDLKAHSFPSFAKHLAGEMNAVHLAALSSGISFGCLSDNLCVAGHRNIWKWVRPNGRVPWVHCLRCSGLLQQKSAQNRHVKDGFFVVGKLKSMLVGTLTTLHFTSTLQRICISILPCMTGHHQPDMLWKSDDGLK